MVVIVLALIEFRLILFSMYIASLVGNWVYELMIYYRSSTISIAVLFQVVHFELAVLGTHVSCSTSTTASTTTGRFTGKACTPIAERACAPTSWPYNVWIKLEKPSATGCFGKTR